MEENIIIQFTYFIHKGKITNIYNNNIIKEKNHYDILNKNKKIDIKYCMKETKKINN